MEYRIERDTMGEVRVPADALWRAQTQRAVENFPISGQRLERGAHPRRWPRSRRPPPRSTPSSACSDADDRRRDRGRGARGGRGRATTTQFPIDVFQTGSGTSSNMNMNEVLATLGRPSGSAEQPSTPTTTSTRRSRPTTSSRRRSTWRPPRRSARDLMPALDHLAAALEAKADEFAEVVKAGRTHLMDATPVTLGQEFSGYAAQVRYGIERLQASAAPAGRAAARAAPPSAPASTRRPGSPRR